MSSYELMEYLEFMPEDGAWKTALRQGEYSEDQMTLRHLTNEVARLRATMHAVHGGQRYEPPVLKSRAQLLAELEDAEASEDRREGFFAFADRTPQTFPDAQPSLDPDDVWEGD